MKYDRYYITYINEEGNQITTAKMVFPSTFINEHLKSREVTNIKIYKCNHEDDVTDMYVVVR